MEIGRYLALRPSKQFGIAILAFAVGIVVHSLAPQSMGNGRLIVAGLTIFFVVPILALVWQTTIARVVLLAVCGFLVGWVRFDSFAEPPRLAFWNGSERVRIEGRVGKPPELRESHQRIILEVESVNDDRVAGNVLVRAQLEPRYEYGDVLRMSCRLESPGTIRGFDEARSLLPKRVFSVCNRPESIAVVGRRANPLRGAVYDLANAFLAGLNRSLPEPQASLAAGLLLGERRLPAEVVSDFQATGTSHIIAVSGYNVSIITVIFFSLLGLVFVPRRMAVGITFGFLAAFVLATGASSSVVRAAIMGSLPFIGQALGRPTNSINALLVTGSGMLIVNPTLLVFDVGFQLSFAAMVGLFVLGPAISERFGWDRETGFHLVDQLRGTAVQTISAILMTLPILLAAFGRVSLIAPIANLFVIFAVPWAMLFSFFAGTFGAIVGPLSFIISAPADLLLRYILEIAHVFSSIPWSGITVERISSLSSFLLYVAIFVPLVLTRPSPQSSLDQIGTPALDNTDGWTIIEDTKS